FTSSWRSNSETTSNEESAGISYLVEFVVFLDHLPGRAEGAHIFAIECDVDPTGISRPEEHLVALPCLALAGPEDAFEGRLSVYLDLHPGVLADTRGDLGDIRYGRDRWFWS